MAVYFSVRMSYKYVVELADNFPDLILYRASATNKYGTFNQKMKQKNAIYNQQEKVIYCHESD